MNIHVTDENILKTLQNSVISRFEFGSRLYGLDNEHSDVDDVAIIAQNNFFANTFLWEHHSLQEATPERDTIYTTMQLLVRNLMTGDSTVYFEIIHDEKCKGTVLEFLYYRRHWFHNLTVIRSYLGYARRDIKHAKESGKRFAHAVRCYYAAKMLFEDGVYYNNISDYDKIGYEYMLALKNGTHGMGTKEMGYDIVSFKEQIDTLRKRVSEYFNSNNTKVSRYMSVERLKEIDKFVIQFSRDYVYTENDFDDIVIEQLYDVLENGIKY